MRVISLSCALLYGQIQASADQDHRLIPSMRTIGNEVDDGRLRTWSGQWRRSGIDGCQLGCCTLVLHRFRVLRTSEPSLVSYRHAVGYRRSPGNLASRVTRSIGECRMSLWSAVVVNLYARGPLQSPAYGSGGGWSSGHHAAPTTPASRSWSTSGPWPLVVDEPHPLVSCSCDLVPKRAVTCIFGSYQFSSLIASRDIRRSCALDVP